MASLTNVITKQITVGTPNPATGTYISPTNLKEPMIPFYRFDLDTYNAACIAFETKISAPGSTSVTWNGPSDPDIYWLQSGDNIFCSFSAVGQTAVFTVASSNSCGTTYTNYRFKCTTTTSCGITPLIVIIAPNPAKSTMNVSLVHNNISRVQQSFQKIKIIDKMGNIKQNNQYPAGTKSTSVNISLLAPDIYTIQIFDGHSWYSEKFIKN
ncbi:MAG: T9SS type A sorting domain-containing protein [Bacteroidetes bacterium]|nr:T9SS type A sorting domain-containing protein [Bacteroidota bacterium]